VQLGHARRGGPGGGGRRGTSTRPRLRRAWSASASVAFNEQTPLAFASTTIAAPRASAESGPSATMKSPTLQRGRRPVGLADRVDQVVAARAPGMQELARLASSNSQPWRVERRDASRRGDDLLEHRDDPGFELARAFVLHPLELLEPLDDAGQARRRVVERETGR